MNKFFFFSLFLITNTLLAQQETIEGKAYIFKTFMQTADSNRITTPILRGSTKFLESFRVHHSTLKKGHKLRPAHSQKNEEEMIIVQSGQLTVTINQKTKTVGAGSVLLIMPGDEQMMNNLGNTDASYFVFIYRSHEGINKARADSTGGSMIIDWNDVAFKAHDKGGRRNFFDRPTAMLNRFEMHVTSLNEGLKSHDLHTHLAEEIILMFQGDTKEQIGEVMYSGTAGDFYYLPSNVQHNLINVGKGQAIYFAFQFN
jgi:(S)-ureidoglycine aminohydrolase